nr:hypothetical protein [Marinicella sp. W31]MDC2876536.1 hypothetical protein [Marinicella sp. W31]
MSVEEATEKLVQSLSPTACIEELLAWQSIRTEQQAASEKVPRDARRAGPPER